MNALEHNDISGPDCDSVQELLFARLDDPGSPAGASYDAEALAAHLANCPACRNYQADTAQLIASLRDLPEVDVPEGLADRVMLAVEAAGVTDIVSVSKPARLPKKRAAAWASIAAAVMVVMMAVPQWEQSQPSPTQTQRMTLASASPVQSAAPLDALLLSDEPLLTGADDPEVAYSDPIDDLIGL